MRLTVIHDSKGNIVSLAAYPLGAPPFCAELKAAQQMIELEAPAEITGDLDARQMTERLTGLMRDYRVEGEGEKRGLVRKP